MTRNCCPTCRSEIFIKNGATSYGKQNYKCSNCGRQFVLEIDPKGLTCEKKELVQKLLLERISLAGISRVVEVSEPTIANYVVSLYKKIPDDLGYQMDQEENAFFLTGLELDEMWSFVFSKKNKEWIWLALDKKSNQIVAMHVGDRSTKSAQIFFESIPEEIRKKRIFFTDHYEAYKSVLPQEQHEPGNRTDAVTNKIERFNCTFRQRCSRLVRKSLSFSKRIWQHIHAFKYFIFHYNHRKYQEYLFSQQSLILIH